MTHFVEKKEGSYLVIKAKEVKKVKEVIKSDGLWRFACGDVFFADQKSGPIDCNYLKLLFCYKGHTDDGHDHDNDHNEGQN